MTRPAALLLPLLFALAACNPPAGAGAPLPEEIRYYSAMYTATAGAEATVVARATATVQAIQFEATSTAIINQIQMTSIASTEIAANVTHSAELRDIELGKANAQATAAQLSITATAEYHQEQARVDAIEREESKERWAWVYVSLVVAWIMLLALIVAWVTSRLAARAVSDWRVAMLPALPAPTVEHKPIAPPAEPEPTRLEKWQEYIVTFCEFGEMARCPELNSTEQFSERRFDLVGVERKMWETTLGWLMAEKVLTRLNESKNSRAIWAGEWGLAKLRREVRLLDIPYPGDQDPPSIDFSVLMTHTHTRAHARTQGATV